MPTLVLTTRGRKTGIPSDLPLIYGRHAGDFVVIAPVGGAPDDPGWLKNLQVTPEDSGWAPALFCTRAGAAGIERAEAWQAMEEIYPT